MTALGWYQFTALALFVVGLGGAVRRRSLVGMFIGLELMLAAATLAFVAAAQLAPLKPGYAAAQGQAGGLLLMGLAAGEAALLLAILVVVLRTRSAIGEKSADVDALSTLKG